MDVAATMDMELRTCRSSYAADGGGLVERFVAILKEDERVCSAAVLSDDAGLDCRQCLALISLQMVDLPSVLALVEYVDVRHDRYLRFEERGSRGPVPEPVLYLIDRSDGEKPESERS
jgi:hypothetical protein